VSTLVCSTSDIIMYSYKIKHILFVIKRGLFSWKVVVVCLKNTTFEKTNPKQERISGKLSTIHSSFLTNFKKPIHNNCIIMT
jgi:hypothetical protein